jgi:hypothetical protein
LSQLRGINLEGTPIKGEGLRHLRGLTNLTSLLLPTEVSNVKELRALRQAIPECNIYVGRKYFK